MERAHAAVTVPRELAARHAHFHGDAGQVWIAHLPALAADLLERWELRVTGPSAYGAVALVLPVQRADGSSAALKLQPVDDETRGEPLALHAWQGDGAARLLAHDSATGSLLLEALEASRSLATLPDDEAATTLLAGLLGRLITTPPPPGLRRLEDIAAGLLDRAPGVLAGPARPRDRRLLGDCSAAVREVLPEPGGRLLHWDLHYDNVLASLPGTGREPWLAIDPKPLVGDPGFELFPALHNRFEDLRATGDLRRALLRRFDLLTEVSGLERQRAAHWTLGRVLQSALWAAESGEPTPPEDHAAIARVLLSRL